LFLLAVVSCGVTVVVQQRGGAVGSLDLLPVSTRIGNAVVAYSEYLRLLFWPSGLAVLYPYPEAGRWTLRIAFTVAVGLGLSALAVARWRRNPWLLIGGLWFVGTLVPMIGLVQVGRQSWADRYTYLPHIGLLIALVWGCGFWMDRVAAGARQGVRPVQSGGVLAGSPDRVGRIVFSLFSVALLLGLLGLSRRQTAVWSTNESLFLHAISVTENNVLAHGNLGTYYGMNGQLDKASCHLQEVLRYSPMDGGARYALGNVYLRQGRQEEALPQYRLAAQEPDQWEAMNDLAWLLATDQESRIHAKEALQWAERSLQAVPPAEIAGVWDTLSVARANAGDFVGAIQAAENALEMEHSSRSSAWRARVLIRIESYRKGQPWHP
jgi:protein O-mannosyl-transferase